MRSAGSRSSHVAAVAGNPRVAGRRTLLARMQSVEFSATVSVLRRAQTTWGRLMTFSGICTLARRDALYAVGGFQPEMATEDISMTWQLQAAGWQVRYEPRALFAMQVPETLGVWWRRRVRWARGMGQVLRRFGATPVSWSRRRLAAIWLEAAVSALWAHAFLVMTAAAVGRGRARHAAGGAQAAIGTGHLASGKNSPPRVAHLAHLVL